MSTSVLVFLYSTYLSIYLSNYQPMGVVCGHVDLGVVVLHLEGPGRDIGDVDIAGTYIGACKGR